MRLIRSGRLLLASLALAGLASSGCNDLPTILMVSPRHGEFTTAAPVEMIWSIFRFCKRAAISGSVKL